jgi:beta-mannosidase
MELAGAAGPDLPAMIGPVPARVPGSVQQALLEAGQLPDWTIGLNSNACEWVENRHWAFQTTLPLSTCTAPGQKLLHAAGLDHAGRIFLGQTEIATFASAHESHTFDLTAAIAAQLPTAPAHGLTLSILFTDPPRYLGQIGHTSQMRDAKPRFYYVWDWVIRLVQIGISDSLTLETRPAAAIDSLRAYTDVSAQTELTATGQVHVELSVANAAPTDTLRLELLDGDTLLTATTAPASTRNLTLTAPDITLWQPIGAGQQKLYTLRTTLITSAGPQHTLTRRLGFRKVTWEACEGAPASAEPWLLNVNGRRHFIYGANWVPIRTNFADVTEADYRKFLQAYADHGFNFLRVWGGATLERDIFFDLCDELGLMVWQEFPYSSSGLDNWTPDDPQAVAQAARIAESYIRRRQHHASLIMWCGGNELQWGDKDKLTGGGIPLGYDHPPIAAMKRICDTLDPTRRFVPTSSSGPSFLGNESDFGKGMHHDVHGPWNIPGTFAEWQKYWAADDALIRSEVGVPGASSAEVIEAYCNGQSLPGDGTNPLWRHVCTWWFQWKPYLAAGGNPQSLQDFVTWSQKRQADGLSVALRACLGRFPRCGGFIIWMGHDCFPCPINTAIFDWHAQPKPAATALAAIVREHGLIQPPPAIAAAILKPAKPGHEPALATV